MPRDTNSGSFILLSIIRPYAVALGYPVTLADLADRLEQIGACRTKAATASVEDPAFLVASLPTPLRQAVEGAGPQMLTFLRVQVASPQGVVRASRFRAVVSGHPALILSTARALRMTPEDLMAMLLDGDAITIRVAEEVAARFGADLDWLLNRISSNALARH